ncbi:unnamed protein product, partial [marine sediment metagenome]
MAKKNVLMLIGGRFHPFEACAEIFKDFIEATGRYHVTVTEDRNKLKARAIKNYDAVAVYTTDGVLTHDQLSGLLGFVRGGGAFIGLHCATASWQRNSAYIDMIGGVFAGHGPILEFPVTVLPSDGYITDRLLE